MLSRLYASAIRKRFTALLALALAALLLIPAGAADVEPTVKIARISGTVEVLHADKTAGKWVLAKKDQTISAGWKLRTGKKSKTQLLFPKDNVVILKENSVLTFDKLDLNGSARLKQDSGSALFDLKTALAAGSTFEVETPSALATVRGTSFGILLGDSSASDSDDADSQGSSAKGGVKRTDEPLEWAPGKEGEEGAKHKGQMGNAQSNPLYEDKGMQGNNPLYEGQRQGNTSPFIVGNDPPAQALDLDGDGKSDGAVGDIDGDGLPDMLFKDTLDSGLNLVDDRDFLGLREYNPAQGLLDAASDSDEDGLADGAIEIGDLDGDGRPDLVVLGAEAKKRFGMGGESQPDPPLGQEGKQLGALAKEDYIDDIAERAGVSPADASAVFDGVLAGFMAELENGEPKSLEELLEAGAFEEKRYDTDPYAEDGMYASAGKAFVLDGTQSQDDGAMRRSGVATGAGAAAGAAMLEPESDSTEVQFGSGLGKTDVEDVELRGAGDNEEGSVEGGGEPAGMAINAPHVQWKKRDKAGSSAKFYGYEGDVELEGEQGSQTLSGGMQVEQGADGTLFPPNPCGPEAYAFLWDALQDLGPSDFGMGKIAEFDQQVLALIEEGQSLKKEEGGRHTPFHNKITGLAQEEMDFLDSEASLQYKAFNDLLGPLNDVLVRAGAVSSGNFGQVFKGKGGSSAPSFYWEDSGDAGFARGPRQSTSLEGSYDSSSNAATREYEQEATNVELPNLSLGDIDGDGVEDFLAEGGDLDGDGVNDFRIIYTPPASNQLASTDGIPAGASKSGSSSGAGGDDSNIAAVLNGNVVIGDLNRDGRPDLALGDLDGDGFEDVAVCIGDLNGDGCPDYVLSRVKEKDTAEDQTTGKPRNRAASGSDNGGGGGSGTSGIDIFDPIGPGGWLIGDGLDAPADTSGESGGMDHSHRLTRGKKSKTYQKMSDQDIADAAAMMLSVGDLDGDGMQDFLVLSGGAAKVKWSRSNAVGRAGQGGDAAKGQNVLAIQSGEAPAGKLGAGNGGVEQPGSGDAASSQKNRTDLKNEFETGDIPDQNDFADRKGGGGGGAGGLSGGASLVGGMLPGGAILSRMQAELNGLDLGDVDGDGIPDLLVLSSLYSHGTGGNFKTKHDTVKNSINNIRGLAAGGSGDQGNNENWDFGEKYVGGGGKAQGQMGAKAKAWMVNNYEVHPLGDFDGDGLLDYYVDGRDCDDAKDDLGPEGDSKVQFNPKEITIDKPTTWNPKGKSAGAPPGEGDEDDELASAKLPRTVLKQYFQTGDMPTQQQFAALIDSSLAIGDLNGDGAMDYCLLSSRMSDSGGGNALFRDGIRLTKGQGGKVDGNTLFRDGLRLSKGVGDLDGDGREDFILNGEDFRDYLTAEGGADSPEVLAAVRGKVKSVRDTGNGAMLEADQDGDGVAEPLGLLIELAPDNGGKVVQVLLSNTTGTFDPSKWQKVDNSEAPVEADAAGTGGGDTEKKVTVRGWDPEKKEGITGDPDFDLAAFGDLDGDQIEDFLVLSQEGQDLRRSGAVSTADYEYKEKARRNQEQDTQDIANKLDALLGADADADGVSDWRDDDCDGDGIEDRSIGDVDGDGRLDVIVAIGDVTGDGKVDFGWLSGQHPPNPDAHVNGGPCPAPVPVPTPFPNTSNDGGGGGGGGGTLPGGSGGGGGGISIPIAIGDEAGVDKGIKTKKKPGFGSKVAPGGGGGGSEGEGEDEGPATGEAGKGLAENRDFSSIDNAPEEKERGLAESEDNGGNENWEFGERKVHGVHRGEGVSDEELVRLITELLADTDANGVIDFLETGGGADPTAHNIPIPVPGPVKPGGPTIGPHGPMPSGPDSPKGDEPGTLKEIVVGKSAGPGGPVEGEDQSGWNEHKDGGPLGNPGPVLAPGGGGGVPMPYPDPESGGGGSGGSGGSMGTSMGNEAGTIKDIASNKCKGCRMNPIGDLDGDGVDEQLFLSSLQPLGGALLVHGDPHVDQKTTVKGEPPNELNDVNKSQEDDDPTKPGEPDGATDHQTNPAFQDTKAQGNMVGDDKGLFSSAPGGPGGNFGDTPGLNGNDMLAIGDLDGDGLDDYVLFTRPALLNFTAEFVNGRYVLRAGVPLKFGGATGDYVQDLRTLVLPHVLEACGVPLGDLDGDGRLDLLISGGLPGDGKCGLTDSDDDGMIDCLDEDDDGDGIQDYLDPDDDGDTVPDVDEKVASSGFIKIRDTDNSPDDGTIREGGHTVGAGQVTEILSRSKGNPDSGLARRRSYATQTPDTPGGGALTEDAARHLRDKVEAVGIDSDGDGVPDFVSGADLGPEFKVTLDGDPLKEESHFKEVSGLESEVETTEYKDSLDTHPHKRPGRGISSAAPAGFEEFAKGILEHVLHWEELLALLTEEEPVSPELDNMRERINQLETKLQNLGLLYSRIAQGGPRGTIVELVSEYARLASLDENLDALISGDPDFDLGKSAGPGDDEDCDDIMDDCAGWLSRAKDKGNRASTIGDAISRAREQLARAGAKVKVVIQQELVLTRQALTEADGRVGEHEHIYQHNTSDLDFLLKRAREYYEEWERYETQDQTAQMLVLYGEFVKLEEEALRKFLDAGGVVVVLDGIIGSDYNSDFEPIEQILSPDGLPTDELSLRGYDVLLILDQNGGRFLPAVQAELGNTYEAAPQLMQLAEDWQELIRILNLVYEESEPIVSDHEELMDKLGGILPPGDPVLGIRNLNLDTDNDGLPDVVEIALGTDPSGPNTDGFIELLSPEDGEELDVLQNNETDFEFVALDTDAISEYTLVLEAVGLRWSRRDVDESESVDLVALVGPGGPFEGLADADGRLPIRWHITADIDDDGLMDMMRQSHPGFDGTVRSEERDLVLLVSPENEGVIVDINSAGPTTVNVGDEVHIRGSISEIQSLGQWEIGVSYDDSLLEFRRGTRLGIFSSSTVFFGLGGGGVVTVSGAAPNGSGGVSGDDDIFELVFLALESGELTIEGDTLTLTDALGGPIDADFGESTDVEIRAAAAAGVPGKR